MTVAHDPELEAFKRKHPGSLPMSTAVQLRRSPDGIGSQLAYGAPYARVVRTLGQVALFGPGRLVAVHIRYGRRTRLFVFRTLETDDRLGARLPGVSPRVQLLMQVRTAGRARLVRAMFACLVERGCNPSGLPDAFYLRVGVVLAGRLPTHKLLLSLLSRSLQSEPVAHNLMRTR
jgi:hypothetical protein